MKTAKAWVSFIGAISTALGGALSDNVFNANDAQQICVTVVVAVITLYAVYKVPNKDV